MPNKIIGIIKCKSIVIKNVVWNFAGSMLSTVILQLCVYPFIAKQHSEEDYGHIIFVMGIINIIILTIGNALGDIRLTRDTKYTDADADEMGDFNVIITVGVALAGIITVLIFGVFGKVFNTTSLDVLITLPIVSMLGTLCSYLLSYFRLRLQFKEGVIESLFLALGYIIGIVLSFLVDVWTLPFLISYIFANAYLIYKTGVFKEGFKRTSLCRGTVAEYSSLSLSYLIKSGMTYVDRFVITPLLGAATLSVFTVSSIFGKSASIAIQPMANVALGYYAQKNFKMTMKKYWITNIVTILFGVLFYGVSLLLSAPFIHIFYPDYVDSAIRFIPISNISVILTAVAAMVQPAILKYCKMAWQLVIQVVYGVIVVGLSCVLIPYFNLLGFCYALIVANVCKLVIMLLVGDYNIRKHLQTLREDL